MVLVASALVLLTVALSNPPTIQGPEVAIPPMLLFTHDFPLWLFKSEVQVALGFELVAVLLLLFQARRLLPPVLRRAVTLPRAVRDAFLLAFAGGASFCGFYIVLDWLREEYPLTLGYGFDPNAPTPMALGEAAFLSMAVAVAGLTVYRSNIGLWASFSYAVTHFAAPVIAALEVGLFIVSPSEMQRHAANILGLLPFPSQAYGISILSNWLVLVVSVFILLCYSVPWARLMKQMPASPS